jgi:hypothetical protein
VPSERLYRRRGAKRPQTAASARGATQRRILGFSRPSLCTAEDLCQRFFGTFSQAFRRFFSPFRKASRCFDRPSRRAAANLPWPRARGRHRHRGAFFSTPSARNETRRRRARGKSKIAICPFLTECVSKGLLFHRREMRFVAKTQFAAFWAPRGANPRQFPPTSGCEGGRRRPATVGILHAALAAAIFAAT